MKHLLMILMLCSFFLSLQSCIGPEDCTVTIATENPGYAYSFDCDYNDYLYWEKKLLFPNQNTMDLGECNIQCWYDSKERELTLHGTTKKHGHYDAENPLKIKCTQRRFEKFKEEIGLKGSVFIWEKIRIVITCERN